MKTVLVTGASGNMGQALVKKFLEEGYSVSGTFVPNDPVQQGIDHPDFEAITVNLQEEAEASDMVTELLERKGKIDAAVLTVGGFAMGDIAATGSKDILQQYRLNFETAYHVARPVFEHMIKEGNGRIFLVGSRPGADMRAGKGMTAYALAKSLLFRLAELMNEEAKGTNVVTAVIIPSTIDTPQNRKSMPDADFSKWVKPEEIAALVCFHCSKEGAALREPVLKIYGGS